MCPKERERAKGGDGEAIVRGSLISEYPRLQSTIVRLSIILLKRELAAAYITTRWYS